MRTLCIIPARGGSKGLPGKNMRTLGGVSLLGRCVRTAAAYAQEYPQHGAVVLVTSDDVTYLQEAHRYGAKHMVHRPAALATDTATSEEAMQHALYAYGQPVDNVVLLQCTSPFTIPEDIARCVAKIAGVADEGIAYRSALTVIPFDGFVWYPVGPRGWGFGATGSNHSPLMPRGRRQDRHGQNFLETGGVYAVKGEDFWQTPNRFSAPIGLVEIDIWRALEIDTAEDLRVAELLYADRQSQEAACVTV